MVPVDMALSKVARYCLESSAFFAQDILYSREGVQEGNKDRDLYGEFHTLYKEYRNDPEKFYEYTRMSVNTFDYILKNIRKDLEKSYKSKKVVTPPEQLFLTLRFLAHGTSFNFLAQSFRLGRTTVSKAIYDTLRAIWKNFVQIYMPQPTLEHLNMVSSKFFSKWQFPNCVGSIGEKHCRIRSRKQHKRYGTMALQAVSDVDYKFLIIEVCDKLDEVNGTIFKSSKLNELLTKHKFNLPPLKYLPESCLIGPHVLVGDDYYPLKTFLMRPYSRYGLDDERQIFNERLLKANSSIHRAFEILTNKWTLLSKIIEPNVKHVKLILEVACLLHNIIRERDGNADKDFYELNPNAAVLKKRRMLRSKCNNRATAQAMNIRDQFKKYFVNHQHNQLPINRTVDT